jgi:hypothetical protein
MSAAEAANAAAAYPAHGTPSMTVVQQVNTKIAPMFNGTTSWFYYEEAIDEWLDITELEVQKQGPALRNRLDGVAATYKPLFDRAKLKEADGVDFFKKFLRPHFVKGAHNVFLWRLFQ